MGVRGVDIAAPFLRKVYAIVSNPETDDIVSWTGNGKQFTVHKLNDFSTKILPSNFNHPNFSSFVRQLNSYGFRKVEHSSWTFANYDFFQGGEENLKKISRKTSQKKQEEIRRGAWEDEGGFGLGGDPRRTALDLHMRQELQICRLEVAHLVHRIGTVEHIQEQLLALLINPQGGAQRAAATSGMQQQGNGANTGQIGDVLESLYKQICESRHSGDTTNLGGWGAYGVNAAVARHPGLAGAAAMGGLGPQVRHDLGGGVGGGLQFGYDALSGLGVTGAGTGGVSNGTGRPQLEALYHQTK
uniref:HSF-type DNA-binding domain-containing protein n=1 Tax=Micromonas pusilla TaxID=38833 RepID=A0A7S0KMR0_MICPS|mmetsp:Transcript_15832/g.61729  ORF Transcript_15832/g.61729 Transcript_15832/m.61729 type:complete len:300 (+) Transcript_15832:103-1002(+)